MSPHQRHSDYAFYMQALHLLLYIRFIPVFVSIQVSMLLFWMHAILVFFFYLWTVAGLDSAHIIIIYPKFLGNYKEQPFAMQLKHLKTPYATTTQISHSRMIILDNQARQQMTRHLLACVIVQNNHPTINSSMPNNFHATNQP